MHVSVTKYFSEQKNLLQMKVNRSEIFNINFLSFTVFETEVCEHAELCNEFISQLIFTFCPCSYPMLQRFWIIIFDGGMW
jgi:hypothetical protein